VDILITCPVIDQLGSRLPTGVEDLQPAEASHTPIAD